MRRSVVALAILLGTPLAAAQAFLPEESLVLAAIERQPEVRAAAARLEASEAEARALAVGPHEIEASAIPQRRTGYGAEAGKTWNEWEVQFGRRMRWPSKARLDREIGDHARHAAELRLDDARHQAARRLLERWMTRLRSAARATLAASQLESLRRERAALARRVELGDAARKDLDLFDVEVAQAQANATGAGAEAAAALAAFRSDFPDLPMPERAPVLPAPEPLPEGAAVWSQRIVERSHEIAAVAEEAARQEATAARVRADRLPDPSIGVRVMNDRGGAERAIGLVLAMPIGGRHRSALAAQQEALAQASRMETETMRRDISREAALTVAEADSRLAQWRAFADALAASDAASRRVQRGWQLGELGLAEWLLAERNRRLITDQEAAARAEAWSARLRVVIDSHDLWHEHVHEEPTH